MEFISNEVRFNSSIIYFYTYLFIYKYICFGKVFCSRCLNTQFDMRSVNTRDLKSDRLLIFETLQKDSRKCPEKCSTKLTVSKHKSTLY